MAAGTEMEMSKTYQYRKVMKPMLERKRRARINKCLDELKDLMVATLESEGEHVTRLEKADILELTVTHLQKLREQRKLRENNGGMILTQEEGFRTGYIYAANEVSRTLAQLPGVNVNLGTQLMTHLGQRLNQIQPPPTLKIPTPIISFNSSSGHCSSSSSSSAASLSSSSSSSSSPLSTQLSLSSSSAFVMVSQLSPMSSRSSSSCAESPQPQENYRQTTDLLMTVIESKRCNRDREEDNVWRPW